MIRIVERTYDDPVVTGLVAEVQQEYVERYGGPDDAVVDPQDFLAPHGTFLVVFDDDVPVATGAYRAHDPGIAEIKRMFVVRSARGRGLSRLLLTELERRAVEAGYRGLVLNSGLRQPEAIGLYESSGYEKAPGFGYYADAPDAVFYRKRLGDFDRTRPGDQPRD